MEHKTKNIREQRSESLRIGEGVTCMLGALQERHSSSQLTARLLQCSGTMLVLAMGSTGLCIGARGPFSATSASPSDGHFASHTAAFFLDPLSGVSLGISITVPYRCDGLIVSREPLFHFLLLLAVRVLKPFFLLGRSSFSTALAHVPSCGLVLPRCGVGYSTLTERETKTKIKETNKMENNKAKAT